MRSVLFIRHAKSSWDNAAQHDFDRPLNDRGKKNAPEMAKRLLDRKVPLDLLVTSPAKRARKTAEFFADAYHLPPDRILQKAELYLASCDSFYEVIAELPGEAHHVALFSHNPGITQLVNQLTDEIRVDNMPTSAVFAIKTEAASWLDFKKMPKQFWFFDYPKMT